MKFRLFYDIFRNFYIVIFNTRRLPYSENKKEETAKNISMILIKIYSQKIYFQISVTMHVDVYDVMYELKKLKYSFAFIIFIKL